MIINKNPIPWPNNARCAACVTCAIDGESLVHLDHPQDGYMRYGALSMLRYDPDVGVPRILDTLKDLDVRQTFYIPAWCIENYTDMIKKIVEAGHEIGHHGFMHENPLAGDREENLYWLRRATKAIVNATGERPKGWRGPLYGFSNISPELLISEGFLYDCSLMGDDQPYVLRSEHGELIEMPAHWGFDDWPQYVHTLDLNYMMPVNAPSEAVLDYREEFDAVYNYGGLWQGVWHPFATGRPSRWRLVAELLDYIKGKGDVWMAPMAEIAAHVRKCTDNGTYKPRVDNLPYHTGPISRFKCGLGI